MEKWTKAKLNLIKYTTLEKYLNNFFYDGESEKINHPLVNLLYHNSEVLNYLNQGLELIIKTSNNSNTTKKLINRLINKFQCNSAIQEIVTIWYICYRIGKENVSIEETTVDNKLPDISVELPNKKIILEVTALNPSRPVEKIEEISEKIAKYVSKLHLGDQNYAIRIGLDNTRFILNRKEEIEVKKSVEFFYKFIHKLYLQFLFNENTHIIFPFTEKKYSIFNWNESLKHSVKSKRVKIDNIDKVNKKWLSSVKTKDFIKSPFKFFDNIIDNVDSQFIEINIPEFDTSDEKATMDPTWKTAMDTRNSIKNQLMRVIKEKYKEKKQYDKTLPFILIIYLENWRFNFEDDFTDFQSIKQNLEETLKPYRYLSGIILYSTYLYDGRYIQNYQSIHRVVEKELIASGILRQRYFQTAFTKPYLDLEKQYPEYEIMEKVYYISNREPEVYLIEDIKSLFSLMNSLLYYLIKNKEFKFKEEIVNRFEIILKKF